MSESGDFELNLLMKAEADIGGLDQYIAKLQDVDAAIQKVSASSAASTTAFKPNTEGISQYTGALFTLNNGLTQSESKIQEQSKTLDSASTAYNNSATAQQKYTGGLAGMATGLENTNKSQTTLTQGMGLMATGVTSLAGGVLGLVTTFTSLEKAHVM